MCGFGSGSVFGIRIHFRIRIHYTGATYVVDDDVLLCDLHPNLLGHGLLAEDNTVQQVQALILYNKIAEDCSTRIMKEIYITYLLRAGASSCLRYLLFRCQKLPLQYTVSVIQVLAVDYGTPVPVVQVPTASFLLFKCQLMPIAYP